MKNINQQYAKFLENKDCFNWKYYATGTTVYKLTLTSARKIMQQLHDILKEKGKIEAKIFFMSEPFDLKYGYHVHFLIDCDKSISKEMIDSIWQIVTNRTKIKNRLDIQKYIYGKGGAAYCSKYIGRFNADYDFLL